MRMPPQSQTPEAAAESRGGGHVARGPQYIETLEGPCVSVLVGAKDRNGAPIDQMFWIARTAKLLTALGGGATIEHGAIGVYRMQDGELVTELVTKVWAYLGAYSDVLIVRDFARDFALAANLECVAIEVGQTLERIHGEPRVPS